MEILKHIPPWKIIADYQAAYERAHGESAPEVVYANGWFRFREGDRLGLKHYRSGDMVHMTGNLQSRAREAGR